MVKLENLRIVLYLRNYFIKILFLFDWKEIKGSREMKTSKWIYGNRKKFINTKGQSKEYMLLYSGLRIEQWCLYQHKGVLYLRRANRG